MKLHLITIGKPKLAYAAAGWEEYLTRLKHYHTIRITHIADKHNDASHISETIGKAYTIALVIDTSSSRGLSPPGLSRNNGQDVFSFEEVAVATSTKEKLAGHISDESGSEHPRRARVSG